MIVMDSPAGYVCRLSQTGTIEYPSSHQLYLKMINICLKLIWMSRLTMEKTIKILNESENDESVISLTHDSTIDELPPCFFVSVTNKKSKQELS